jgi:hypothetical protein
LFVKSWRWKTKHERFIDEKATVLPSPNLPNLDAGQFHQPDPQRLFSPARATHPPRILPLYGSLRERIYSRVLTQEAAGMLQAPWVRNTHL